MNASPAPPVDPSAGAYGFREFIQNLLSLLADDDHNIIRYAARALRDYDTVEVRDGLLQRLVTCPPQCVDEMVATLESFHGEDAGKLFFTLAGSSSADVRAAAIERLGPRLPETAAAQVWSLLERETEPRCIASLLSMARRLVPPIQDEALKPFLASEDARVRANALELLARLPGELKVQLVEPLLDDPTPRVRANAIKLLWPAQGPALWQRLLGELESGDEKRELSAIYLLGQVPGPAEAATLLVDRLGSSNLQLRLLASKSLLTCQAPVDCQALCALYLNEEHSVIRQNLMSYCRQGQAEAAVGVFATMLENPGLEAQIRATAARALGDLAYPKAIPILMTALKDADPRVRSNVIDALARCPCEGMMDMLLPCLADANPRVQATAALAVWRLGGADAVDVLLKMLRSSDSRKQSSAAFALGEIGHGEMVEPLSELLDELQSTVVTTEAQRQVQKNVMRALTKLRTH